MLNLQAVIVGVLAAWGAVHAVAGVVMIATSDDLPKDFDVLGSIVVVAGALVVCLLGAAGAILLWRGRSMHAGLLCLLFLVPQIPDFAIRGLQYNFIVGGQVGPELGCAQAHVFWSGLS